MIGAGHNGLTCAAYLAAAGLKVTVLERRDVVGGAAGTEEFNPGFRNAVASYTVSLLNPKVIADLELARHGLRVVARRAANFLPFEGARLLTGAGRPRAGRTGREQCDEILATSYSNLPVFLACSIRFLLRSSICLMDSACLLTSFGSCLGSYLVPATFSGKPGFGCQQLPGALQVCPS